MLMLGAQILIGFELRSAFQERFDSLHQSSKWVAAVSLLPLAIGLACDIFVMLARIARDPAIGIGAGALAGLVLLGFWYVQPLILRARHGR
jgi:hypothetical protein